MADTLRPRIFLDVSVGTEPIGRIVMELFTDKAPKTCENFRALCTGTKPTLSYKMAPFHRIIDEFMIQGGDITKGDGTGGDSIYGGEFEDENIGWRDLDAAGLLCMANHGKDTNSSQFFITLVPCPHLNAKHTIFGRVVSGQQTIDRMAKVEVNDKDEPFEPVLISHCGELERRNKATRSTNAFTEKSKEPDSAATSVERGRHKRRHSGSRSPSRSVSPSRGHNRDSASRHRHHHRKHHRASSSESMTPPEQLKPRDRRRSDADPDHTQRGRARKRTSGEIKSPVGEAMEISDVEDRRQKRSSPPSRPDSRSRSPESRRQRSLPNQYDRRDRTDRYDRDRFERYQKRDDYSHRVRDDRRGGRRDERQLRESESTRDSGRLGGGDDSWGDEGGDGIIYKGRGSMKFREQRRW